VETFTGTRSRQRGGGGWDGEKEFEITKQSQPLHDLVSCRVLNAKYSVGVTGGNKKQNCMVSNPKKAKTQRGGAGRPGALGEGWSGPGRAVGRIEKARGGGRMQGSTFARLLRRSARGLCRINIAGELKRSQTARTHKEQLV